MKINKILLTTTFAVTLVAGAAHAASAVVVNPPGAPAIVLKPVVVKPTAADKIDTRIDNQKDKIADDLSAGKITDKQADKDTARLTKIETNLTAAQASNGLSAKEANNLNISLDNNGRAISVQIVPVHVDPVVQVQTRIDNQLTKISDNLAAGTITPAQAVKDQTSLANVTDTLNTDLAARNGHLSVGAHDALNNKLDNTGATIAKQKVAVGSGAKVETEITDQRTDVANDLADGKITIGQAIKDDVRLDGIASDLTDIKSKRNGHITLDSAKVLMAKLSNSDKTLDNQTVDVGSGTKVLAAIDNQRATIAKDLASGKITAVQAAKDNARVDKVATDLAGSKTERNGHITFGDAKVLFAKLSNNSTAVSTQKVSVGDGSKLQTEITNQRADIAKDLADGKISAAQAAKDNTRLDKVASDLAESQSERNGHIALSDTKTLSAKLSNNDKALGTQVASVGGPDKLQAEITDQRADITKDLADGTITAAQAAKDNAHLDKIASDLAESQSERNGHLSLSNAKALSAKLVNSDKTLDKQTVDVGDGSKVTGMITDQRASIATELAAGTITAAQAAKDNARLDKVASDLAESKDARNGHITFADAKVLFKKLNNSDKALDKQTVSVGDGSKVEGLITEQRADIVKDLADGKITAAQAAKDNANLDKVTTDLADSKVDRNGHIALDDAKVLLSKLSVNDKRLDNQTVDVGDGSKVTGMITDQRTSIATELASGKITAAQAAKDNARLDKVASDLAESKDDRNGHITISDAKVLFKKLDNADKVLDTQTVKIADITLVTGRIQKLEDRISADAFAGKITLNQATKDTAFLNKVRDQLADKQGNRNGNISVADANKLNMLLSQSSTTIAAQVVPVVN